MGDPSGWRGNERNAVWRNLLGLGTRVRHTPESERAFEAHWSPKCTRPPTAIRPTSDYSGWSRNCARPVTGSPGLWDSGAVGRSEAARKTIDHP